MHENFIRSNAILSLYVTVIHTTRGFGQTKVTSNTRWFIALNNAPLATSKVYDKKIKKHFVSLT